jgi:hypothetical protein
MQRARRAAAAAALCASIALAACGGDDGGTGVASLTGGSTSTTATKDGEASAKDLRDALLDYTRCLRKEGIDVDDPTFGDSGPSGGGSAGSDGRTGAVLATPAGRIELPSPDDPAFQKADAKCKPILEAARQSAPKPSAEEQAKARDHALAFAKCMREHGVDMPDPTFDGEGRISMRLPGPAGEDPGGPLPETVTSAQEACQDELPPPRGGKLETRGD